MQVACLCHSKCLRTLRRQTIIVAGRFDDDCCQICLRKSCGLGSAKSCGFKGPKQPLQIRILVENIFISMLRMWLTANFRPERPLRPTDLLGGGWLELEPAQTKLQIMIQHNHANKNVAC